MSPSERYVHVALVGQHVADLTTSRDSEERDVPQNSLIALSRDFEGVPFGGPVTMRLEVRLAPLSLVGLYLPPSNSALSLTNSRHDEP